MDYDHDKFTELRDYADHMRTLSGDRDTMLDRMRDIYMLKDADADKLKEKFANILVTISPDPANAVDTAVRLMTANEPDFSVPADLHADMDADAADRIEKLAGVVMRASDRVRGAPVCVDGARSGLLYDEIILSVNDTDDMTRDAGDTSKAAKKRLDRAAGRSPFLLDVVDPHGCYYDVDHLGLRAFARLQTMTGQQIIETWGDDGRNAISQSDVGKARKTEYQVWQVWDLANYTAYIDGGSTPIIMEPHELPFIPWVVRKVEGTRLFPDREDQSRPFLYSLDKSGLWKRQNMALSAVFSRVQTRMWATLIYNADLEDEDPYVDMTAPINFVRVPRENKLTPFPSDPAENELKAAYQLTRELTEQSTLYRQVAGQALGPNATYSETALLQQAGRLPLTAVKRALEWALGDALALCFLWLKEPGGRRKRGNFQKLKAADIPDDLEIEARLQLALPQDRLQQANIFNVLKDRVPLEYLYENILNIRQPGEVTKNLWRERITDALAGAQLQQIVQQASAAQPPPPAMPQQAPPPDMGMGMGGLPPEMMAGGMQGPETPAFEQGMVPPGMGMMP